MGIVRRKLTLVTIAGTSKFKGLYPHGFSFDLYLFGRRRNLIRKLRKKSELQVKIELKTLRVVVILAIILSYDREVSYNQ